MIKEIIGYTVIAVLLVMIFLWPRSDWRTWQKMYQAPESGTDSANVEKTAAREKMEPPDSVDLESLNRLIGERNFQMRLDRIADSLLALKLELARYSGILLSARERVRESSFMEKDKLSPLYFSGRNTVSGIGNGVEEISGEIDSLRRDLLLAGKLQKSAEGPEDLRASRIRWISPAQVPVREACTSCHEPVSARKVMLRPGKSSAPYPKEMLAHPPARFGCTICHLGGAGELSFWRAHGPDYLDRPFRKGKLALRSCGLCHAAKAQPMNLDLSSAWSKNCADCHESAATATISADSAIFSNIRSPRDELKLRSWLIRHWGEKAGRIPDRESFEEVVTLLISGNNGKAAANSVKQKENSPPDDKKKLNALRCPVCGRTFSIAAGGAVFVCPLDGARLEPVRAD